MNLSASLKINPDVKPRIEERAKVTFLAHKNLHCAHITIGGLDVSESAISRETAMLRLIDRVSRSEFLTKEVLK
jgi:hypothetical protein